MPSSHCTILAPIFTRRQVFPNCHQMPEIRGKSVLFHASDNHAVWIIKDAIWENCRCPWNVWHAKYLDLPAIQNPAVWNEFWLKKYIGDDLQPMREQDTGQREVQGGVKWNVVCRADRVVGDSSYCKAMQCVTSCRRCEHSSNWMLPQCETNDDPSTLKIMQCELGIGVFPKRESVFGKPRKSNNAYYGAKKGTYLAFLSVTLQYIKCHLPHKQSKDRWLIGRQQMICRS